MQQKCALIFHVLKQKKRVEWNESILFLNRTYIMKRLLFLLPIFLITCTVTEKVDWEIVSLKVSFTNQPSCGLTEDNKCEFSLVDDSYTIDLKVEAMGGSGFENTFSRSVLLSMVPAGIFSTDNESVKTLPDGRRAKIVKLQNGIWTGSISFKGGFGNVRIFAEDVGYEPTENLMNAACYHEYPGVGCFAPDDNNANIGSGAAGVSEEIFFDNPRIKDIQKPTDESAIGGRDGDYTPLDGFRVTVDGDPYLGVDACAAGEARIVVTAVGVAGFYVTDVCNRADPSNVNDPIISDYASLFVYNFNTPEDMYKGDCVTMFQGAVDEFQGFTEMKNPFWTIDMCTEHDDYCVVDQPKCKHLIPEPIELTSTILSDAISMEKLESAVVRVTNAPSVTEFRVCDFNGDGVIDYDNYEEDQCKEQCGNDVKCVVKEDFDRYFTWTIEIEGQEVGVVTKGIVSFDPELDTNLGKTIYSITGTLKHLSFGSPAWIITPRGPEDFCLTAQDCE
jgi:hypothetical protein